MVQMTGPRHAFKIVALGPKIGGGGEEKGNKQSEGKVIIPTRKVCSSSSSRPRVPQKTSSVQQLNRVCF